MDWIADNFQLFLALLILVGYILKSVLGNRTAGHDEDAADEPHREITTADQEEEERTRRIQEEIRRRILARQRGEDPAPTPPALPRTVTTERAGAATVSRSPARPVPPPLSDAASQAILDRQRRLAEQMSELRRGRTKGEKRGGRLQVIRPAEPEAVKCQRLLSELSRRQSLRRAVLFREILGPPLALETKPLDLPRR